MRNAFIFFGADGNSQENWFPWLKGELEQNGIKTVIPDFPHSDAPKLDEWSEYFKQYEATVGTDSILIGHSLGCAFALRFLEKTTVPVRATFLISPVWRTPANEYAPLMKTFTEKKYFWKSILKNAGKISMFHSENDPYLPLQYAKELTLHLPCDLSVVSGGGHFNTASGFATFSLLRDSILSLS